MSAEPLAKHKSRQIQTTTKPRLSLAVGIPRFRRDSLRRIPYQNFKSFRGGGPIKEFALTKR